MLRNVAKHVHRDQFTRAAEQLKQTRKKGKAAGSEVQRGQLLRPQVWGAGSAGQSSTSSTRITSEAFWAMVDVNVDNPATYRSLLQLLRLGQFWEASQKERILASVIGQLDEREVKTHASLISRLYTRVEESEEPKELLELRIALRSGRKCNQRGRASKCRRARGRRKQ